MTIAILTYHSLDESGSILSTPPRIFAEQMRILSELDVRVIPLGQVQHQLQPGLPPECLVAITFDDGFRNVYQHGFPALQRYGFPATVFLVTDHCERTNSWPSQPRFAERRPLLQWNEIREMSAAGIAFGSHTRTHPDLRTLPRVAAEEELVTSKKVIEDVIGRSVDTFAYPYGAYDDTIRRLAQAHFSLACATDLDFARTESDPFALERLDMYYLRRSVLFRRLFSSEIAAYIRSRRSIRELRRRLPRGIRL